jgi:penicillin-binding protein 2
MSLMPTQGEGRDYRTRYAWALVLALGTLGILAGRLYQLQVVRGDHYSRLSRSNFIKRLDVPADRGMIVDRRGAIVVDARPSYDVEITPAFSPDVHGTVDALARVLDLEEEALARIRERIDAARGLERFRPVPVRRDVGRDALDWLESRRIDLDGVDVRVRPQRHYRYGEMLAHVLGYMNEIGAAELARAREADLDYRMGDMIGRSGLEERFESALRGRDGMEQVVVDAKGRRMQQDGDGPPLIPDEERLRESVPGHNLVLSVDMRLQQIAEEAFPGLAGSIVAVDPQTGYILAMVSRPGFDPNRLSGRITAAELRELAEDPLQPILHRTIQQHYTPGSTFKVATALAGLQSGAVTGPDHGTSCGGGYQLGRRRWRCWHAGGHGFQALHGSLMRSCNVYYYWTADRMGIDPLAEWARNLGFGRRTGIGLPHEIPGIVPDRDWYRQNHPEGYQHGFALNASIGQGDITATPLQLAMAYAALSNGGILYRPQLVRRVEDAYGNLVEEFQPEVTGRLDVPPEHLQAIVQGLRAVVNEPGGTAFYRRPRDLEVEVAGKTGTSQVVRIGQTRVRHEDRPYEHRNHAVFAAFAPVEDAEIAVAVIHEHGGSGGRDAAPAAMAVIEGYFALKAQDEAERALGIPPPPTEPSPSPGRDRPSPPPAIAPPSPARHARDPEPTPVPLPSRPPPIDVTRG